ncbi:MAG: glycosyltransferase family 4 protein [Bacteroidota bacterium]|nr:glycosyltransferase family 4 protein [Bacteroidota bacterium]
MTRRVLVIAYYFPPLGLSGVQRTFKFVKYLPAFGWEPTVLTVEERGYFARDESFLEELAGLPVEIVRTPSLDPLHLFRRKKTVDMPSGRAYRAMSRIEQAFFIPDNKIGWKKYALRSALSMITPQESGTNFAVAGRRDAEEATKGDRTVRRFDLVFATAPPFTSFLVGRDIKIRTGLPLVLDYRDPWLENPLHSYPTFVHRALHHRLERSVLRWADGIITINRRMKELTLRSSTAISHNDITIIPQGFDPEDFAGTEPARRDNRMRITHAGTFYHDRTPQTLLRALRSFLDGNPDARGCVVACFAGNFRSEDHRLVDELGLRDDVEILGYLPHRQCVAELRRADALWMTIGASRGMEVVSTGKLYEYIGAGKPILASIPECEARRTLAGHGAAYISGPNDAESLARNIETLFGLFRQNALPAPRPQFAEQFDRRRLTGELVRVFEGIVHHDEYEAW